MKRETPADGTTKDTGTKDSSSSSESGAVKDTATGNWIKHLVSSGHESNKNCSINGYFTLKMSIKGMKACQHGLTHPKQVLQLLEKGQISLLSASISRRGSVQYSKTDGKSCKECEESCLRWNSFLAIRISISWCCSHQVTGWSNWKWFILRQTLA